VTDLREDGGLAVARGWKHEELAGAAIERAAEWSGDRQLGGSDERVTQWITRKKMQARPAPRFVRRWVSRVRGCGSVLN
jgi:hypothetical protein